MRAARRIGLGQSAATLLPRGGFVFRSVLALFEVALVLVRFDHVARLIDNTDS
jgi:hypothetical protein